MIRFILLGIFFGLFVPCQELFASNLGIFIAGTPAKDAPCRHRTQSVVLMGGGPDVRAAYTWLNQKAQVCGDKHLGKALNLAGNLVVLRSVGDGSYDKTILELGNIASVQTLVVPDRAAANDPAIESHIKNASVIWIAGGDQSIYYQAWKGSRLLTFIKNRIRDDHVPFGGSSAGMMILGNFIHVGDPSHILMSAEALENPYNPHMVLEKDFWGNAKNSSSNAPISVFSKTITDSHFENRDRMGRAIAFMARDLANRWISPYPVKFGPHQYEHAIAVDQQTALLIEQKAPDQSFQAAILTNPNKTGSAYFLKTLNNPYCDKSGELLDKKCDGSFTLKATQVDKLKASASISLDLFNLSTWQPTANAKPNNYIRYSVDISNGKTSVTGNAGNLY